MTATTEADVLDFLHNEGITLVGIAVAEHLASVPDEFSPHAVLKEAQSVICYAVPIPKGILYADHHGEALYWRFCNMTYRFLDIISDRLSSFLEEENCVTAPVYGCYP